MLPILLLLFAPFLLLLWTQMDANKKSAVPSTSAPTAMIRNEA